jgi:enoyl-CoA hydratase
VERVSPDGQPAGNTAAGPHPKDVELTRDGAVAILTIRAGAQRNALDGEVAGLLASRLLTAGDDPSVGALVIAAEGPDYCSGGNLGLLRRAGADPAAPAAFQETGAIYEMFSLLATSPVPTVAAAQGHLMGAGVNLALAADIVIASDDVVFQGFGRSGMHPGGGHLSLLIRKAPAAAPALALFGQVITAEDAVRTGLAWTVVPRDQLLGTAVEVAKAAATDPELARAVTATYRAAADARLPVRSGYMLERAAQMWSLRRAVLRQEGHAGDRG